MLRIELEKQEAQPIDDATKAALEAGLAQLQRGEGVPLEQVRENIKQRSKARRKAQEPITA